MTPKNLSFCHEQSYSASICNQIHRGWNMMFRPFGGISIYDEMVPERKHIKANKLKIETLPTSNILQHFEWFESLWIGSPIFGNRPIVSIHCRLPRWLVMLMPCALPQIEDDAPKRTAHASLVCYPSSSIACVYSLLFMMNRYNCCHPHLQIFTHTYIYMNLKCM